MNGKKQLFPLYPYGELTHGKMLFNHAFERKFTRVYYMHQLVRLLYLAGIIVMTKGDEREKAINAMEEFLRKGAFHECYK